MEYTHKQHQQENQRHIGLSYGELEQCTIGMRKVAYISLVRSTMEYGTRIWNPYIKGDIDKLDRIQNRGIRFLKKNKLQESINRAHNQYDMPA